MSCRIVYLQHFKLRPTTSTRWLVYTWPNHFPAQCPPSNSAEASGTLFRFINGRAPSARDFLSHYERDPHGQWDHDPCNARGLSVLKTYEDCTTMRKGVPALRKKRLASGAPLGAVGLMASTPSRTCRAHCTWWRSIPPDRVLPFFTAVSESIGDKCV